MNATSKTPQQNTAEFLNELAGLGFKPGRWDQAGSRDRQLDLRNEAGHRTMRIVVSYEGEPRPHSITILKLDGKRSELTEWEAANLPAAMPTTGILALIKSALPARAKRYDAGNGRRVTIPVAA